MFTAAEERLLLPSLRYEDPGLGDVKVEDPTEKTRLELARSAGEIANNFYPGHPWYVEIKPPIKYGQHVVIQISIPALMGRWSWNIPTDTVQTSEDLRKAVMRGCGELLERYRMPRQGFNASHFAEAIATFPAWMRIYGVVPD